MTNHMDLYRCLVSRIGREVFRDIVPNSIQNDGQRIIDAMWANDLQTIRRIQRRYERDAGLAQGGGGAGPGKVKTPRRGAVTAYDVATKWLSVQ